jgi:hypothetical protein
MQTYSFIIFLGMFMLPALLLLHCKDTIPKTKQTFPEKELRGLSPNFHVYVSVSDLYIPTIGLPILLQENMWTRREIIL